ncbi:hypothetical protein PCASD_01627 [Puccinia coronata f. sp. avenae]|uniref:ATP-dependent DNA helicase II subunit 2 n=1 Tax=Puccinia coronata f. sp. avenae TaxID=200324 RepID=A0A2N5VID6_9BASI|nr:hypothetical protein PCASD_01627 [Puccinia coronata f. sp. avenae]
MAGRVTATDPSSGTTRSMTRLEYGLEVVKHQVANMLLAGLKTAHCGIVLFGTDHTQNSLAASGYEYIWEFISPSQPSALTLSRISSIPLHQTSSVEPFKGDLLSAIILCNHLMGETLAAKKWARKLVVVTDGRTETDWNGWKEQMEKMRIDEVTLNVIGLDFDDPQAGYIEPTKPETKATNEAKLQRLCKGLSNNSSCSTARAAVMNAQAPQPRVTGSNPTLMMLSLGYPDSETAKSEGYDAQETLFIRCELQKCTTIVRPMSTKKMSKFGVSSELERRRKDLEAASELEQHPPGHADDEDDDYLPGLLQTNRKHVYVNKQNKDGHPQDAGDDSDDPDMKLSSDDEPAPLESREADQDSLAKAYKYGSSLVIFDKEDEAKIRQTFSPSLEIRGFTALKTVPRHHLLNNVYYLSPLPSDPGSQLAFSALVRAMHDANRAAIARYVSRSVTAEPKMVILIPVVESTIRYFLFIQVPFAEDLREYLFPSLPSTTTSPNKKSNAQYVPTKEMEEAMDDLVDKMDLSAEDESSTVDGRTQPWLELENACNPAVHHVKNCVLHRLGHPDSKDLACVHPALAKYMAPPPHVAERVASTLERVIQLADVKAVPSQTKSKRKNAASGNPADANEKINLDDILGDILDDMDDLDQSIGAEDIHREEYTEIEYAQEHESFKTLHPLDLEDSDQIFLNFDIDVSFVQQYHCKLDLLVRSLAEGHGKYMGTLYKTLIQLAHFRRFPNTNFCHSRNDAMLQSLQKTTSQTNVKPQQPEPINRPWSVNAVKAGLLADYKRANLIIDPILANLRNHAKECDPTIHKAPYTSIIGPSMIGKTRAIMQLAQNVCVVYICLRPTSSSGQPTRSHLADTMLPSTPNDLLLHYSKLLAAIFEAVAEFFSRPDIQNLSMEQGLENWYKHSFPNKNDKECFFQRGASKNEKLTR